MKKLQLFVCAGTIFLSLNSIAQEEAKEFTPTFNWSGFTHIWTSYGENDSQDADYGFTVRYLRFKASGKLTEKVSWTAQIGLDKGAADIKDIFVTYSAREYLNVRLGQFPVPGVKTGNFSSPIWSTTKMMFNDRAGISQAWATNSGTSGFRNGGAVLFGSFLEKKINYYLMGAVSQGGAAYYFTPNVKSASYSNKQNGLTLYSRLEFQPIEKMETGVSFHTGQGTLYDTTDIKSGSYSFYLLTRQDKWFVMAEYIAGNNEESNSGTLVDDFSYNGYVLELAYKLAEKYEPALRYDSYTPIKDGSEKGIKNYSNISIGFNYYPAKNMAIMANYVLRMEDPDTGYSELDNNLFYIQFRYLFSSK